MSWYYGIVFLIKIAVDCEMGEWTNWAECKCPSGKKCVPHDSKDTCKRKRTKPLAKQGANGGNNDCKKEYAHDDCTKKCKRAY